MRDNKLIAEFMGDGKEYEIDINTKTLKSYHTSWNWLMPVIEEIDHLQFEPIESIEKALFTRSIRDTHKAVVEFIKQYNDEQNKA